jgi:hypothetical protein
MSEIMIGTPVATDKPEWRRLYDGYAAFYKVPMNDEIADRVWGWINDPAHGVEALVARTRAGQVIGLAHFRACRVHSTEAPPVSSTTFSSIPNSATAESPTSLSSRWPNSLGSAAGP